jgi:hypothetical protein
VVVAAGDMEEEATIRGMGVEEAGEEETVGEHHLTFLVLEMDDTLRFA